MLTLLNPSLADEPKTGAIKVGVLTDLSGPLADWSGRGSVNAAALAVEDYVGGSGRYKVEIISADHQNKPDVATSTARRWISDEGVNVIIDVPNSGVALAVNEVVRGSSAALLASAATNVNLIGKACSPNAIMWTTDSWALSNTAAKVVIGTGKKKWFFLTADFAGGIGLEQGAVAAVTAAGGEVVGKVRFPFDTMDYASFLLQAQSSGAQAIGLAVAGAQLTTLLKQADEFGLGRSGQTVVGLAMFLTDVHALGLKATQGVQLASAYYWDLNDGTRAFAQRFAARMKGKYPTQMQAGAYGSLLHYLKAVDAAQSVDGRLVVRKMKELPVDDPVFGKTTIRQDGRTLVDQFLFEVKSPAESRGEWVLYKHIKRVPASEAYLSLAEGGCPIAVGVK
jgi:branched-chain amino acid transport system substrate-binding protein